MSLLTQFKSRAPALSMIASLGFLNLARADEDTSLAGCSVELDSYIFNLIDLNKAT